MKRKLLFAMLCIVSALGMRAQTWTASEVAAGNYVLYNVGKGQFLTAGNAWGTQASMTTTGVSGATQVELIANGSNWFIRTGVGATNYGLENLADAGAVYMDQSRGKQSTWTFTQVATDNGPVYTITSANNHGGGSGAILTANSGNTVVSDNGTASSSYAQWKLLSATTAALLNLIEDYNSVRATIVAWTTSSSVTEATAATATFNTALAAADDKVANATTEAEINEAIADLKAAGNTFLENVIVVAGIDITNAWITNPAPYANGNGWTLSADATYDSGNRCAEYWNKSGATIKQTLTNLPKGAYRLTAIALTRTGRVATLSAGTASMNIATVSNGTVNSRSDANTWFNNGNGVNNLDFTLDAAATSLEIGLTADNTTADYWMVWRSFSLTYYGDPINKAKSDLAAAVAEAEALDGAIPGGVYTSVAAVVTENNKTYSTVAEYEAATAAIVAAVNSAKPLKTPYSRYTTIKAAALAIAADLNTTDADNAVNAATTAAEIEAAIPTLRAAFLAKLATLTVPTDPGYFDVTAVMVDNAGVHTSTDYWTIEGTPNTNYSWAVCNYGECEFYQQNFKFYQTLALTPGTWEFGVTGFHRAGNHNTNFYAGEDKILIPGVESSVVNNMAQAQTYFDNGNGKVALKFLVETAQNIEIGINNQDTQTDKWTIFRDFTLKYYGAPDYTVYENEWANLVAEANTAKTTYANVTGTELTVLNAAIGDSPTGSNLKATYIAKINALQDALSAFNTAGPSYNKYAAYRAETVALFGEALAETVAAPTTAAEALVAVQNLNIAQYNKVATDYTFSATGLIGDFGSWTGTATVAGAPATPNYLDWEHWSGTYHAYYEQASTGWANANGWTIQYQKVCTLPAGDYVIKVAARSSAGTTSSVTCSATDKTISLPNQGSPGRGITTSGVASWSDSDMFANGDINSAGNEPTVGGKGTGWQWRFLPFSLSAQTEVTMTFYAEASSQYQWMSIADGELLSTTKLAQDVNYNETSNNTIENTIIADVTVSRAIKDGYNTVVLPFTLTANQVTTAFGAGTEVYNFSETSDDSNDVTINFTKGDGSITANTPVLVKATAASSAQTFEGVQIVAPEYGAQVGGNNVSFVGTYAPTTVASGDYFVSGGLLYKSAGSTNLKAFRAYIDAQEASSVKMFIDGLETAISAINAEAEAEQGAIYNLAGQRVSKAVRGIYVKNGKKVVVK